MEISEVRVRLVGGGGGSGQERLRAFCSVTFDGDFVIRDLKVIEGDSGYFVAMPSRKLSYRCPRCRTKNHLRAKHCNECGSRLGERHAPRDANGRAKLHVDVAHPINTACRERIQQSVIEAFRAELSQAQQPGYQPAPIDEDDELEGTDYNDLVADLKQSMGRRDEQRRAAPAAGTFQTYDPDGADLDDAPAADDAPPPVRPAAQDLPPAAPPRPDRGGRPPGREPRGPQPDAPPRGDRGRPRTEPPADAPAAERPVTDRPPRESRPAQPPPQQPRPPAPPPPPPAPPPDDFSAGIY
ncbi:MAG: septation protein SpoVG family protein [Phycisphaerae bacterium]